MHDPMLGDIHPNIMCFQNEPTCSSDTPTGLIKNIDYKADPSPEGVSKTMITRKLTWKAVIRVFY